MCDPITEAIKNTSLLTAWHHQSILNKLNLKINEFGCKLLENNQLYRPGPIDIRQEFSTDEATTREILPSFEEFSNLTNLAMLKSLLGKYDCRLEVTSSQMAFPNEGLFSTTFIVTIRRNH